MLDLFWPGVEPVSADEHRDVGLIESALARPIQTFDGEFLIQGVERQGAALFHSLITNHSFFNGNKRTAVVALDLFFIANGYWLALGPDEIHDLAVRTADYRGKGLEHDAMFREIVEALKDFVVPFAELDAETAEFVERLRTQLTTEACVRV
jgi:death-on-curing family protein